MYGPVNSAPAGYGVPAMQMYEQAQPPAPHQKVAQQPNARTNYASPSSSHHQVTGEYSSSELDGQSRMRPSPRAIDNVLNAIADWIRSHTKRDNSKLQSCVEQMAQNMQFFMGDGSDFPDQQMDEQVTQQMNQGQL